MQIPSPRLENVARADAIRETANGFLKFGLAPDFTGEFKILKEKKDVVIVGLSLYSCAESTLEIWSVKNGRWQEITASAAPQLGAKDVVEMLKVSPATVEKLGTEVAIPYFFTFAADENSLRLVVRKQSSCEIAGPVHDYRFEEKKFVRR